MIYKFQSKATGDVLMAGPAAEAVLRAMGIEPAVQGIVEPAAMPAAIRAIEAAIGREEASRARVEAPGAAKTADDVPASDDDEVSLRQRAWPMVEMLKRALAADTPVVWGV